MTNVNDKEKIVWDSMISAMVMGKVIPIKIIDGDQFINENIYIDNLDESCLKELGIKLAFDIDDYIIKNILKISKFTNNELSLNSISDAMENIASNGYLPNVIFLEDKSRLNSLPEITNFYGNQICNDQIHTLLGMEVMDLKSTYNNLFEPNKYNCEAIIFDKNQIGIIGIVEKIKIYLEYDIRVFPPAKIGVDYNFNILNEISVISILKNDDIVIKKGDNINEYGKN